MKYSLPTFIVIINILNCPFIYGQDECSYPFVPTIYIADLDLDGLQDTVRYDNNAELLTFSLSGNNYIAEEYPGQTFYINQGINDGRELSVYDGGFSIYFRHMRAWSEEEYRYDGGSFTLQRLSYEHISYGSMLYECNSQMFVGKWWFWDVERELIELPEAKLILDHPFYWGQKPEIVDLGLMLFEDYQSIYKPETTAVLMLNHISGNESDERETLYYRIHDSIYSYGTIYCNYVNIQLDDYIEVTTGTHFYVEPGDGSWHAVRGITAIKPVKNNSPTTSD